MRHYIYTALVVIPLAILIIIALLKISSFVCKKIHNFWHLLILVIVFIATDVYLAISPQTNLREPAPLEVQRNCAIESRLSDGNVLTKLRKGDIVKFYGYNEKFDVLVENDDGVRGYVKSYELGLPILYKKDTLSFVSKHEEENKYGNIEREYVFKTDNGEEKKVSSLHSSYKTAFPDDIGAGSSKLTESKFFRLSEKKFKTLCEGKNISQVEQMFCPPTSMTGKEAVFTNIVVYDFDEGLLYSPALFFDDSMNVSGFGKYGVENSEKIKFLKYMKCLPGFKLILDSRLLPAMLRGSMYEPPVAEKLGGNINDYWYKKLAVLLFAFIWYCLPMLIWFCSVTIPVFALILLAKNRYTFYHLNNLWLSRLLGLILILSAYIWFLALAAKAPKFAIPWLLVEIFFAFFLVQNIVGIFNNQFIRCNSCKRMYKMKVDRVVLVKEWNEACSETDKKRVGYNRKHLGDTWTENTVVTKNGLGQEIGRYSYKTDQKSHYSVRETYREKHYRVVYNFKTYNRIYKCSVCGQEAIETYTEQKEIDRKLVDESEYTTEHKETF